MGTRYQCVGKNVFCGLEPQHKGHDQSFSYHIWCANFYLRHTHILSPHRPLISCEIYSLAENDTCLGGVPAQSQIPQHRRDDRFVRSARRRTAKASSHPFLSNSLRSGTRSGTGRTVASISSTPSGELAHLTTANLTPLYSPVDLESVQYDHANPTLTWVRSVMLSGSW
jgi:hypothetical protein